MKHMKHYIVPVVEVALLHGESIMQLVPPSGGAQGESQGDARTPMHHAILI